jgi:hypothetical protein
VSKLSAGTKSYTANSDDVRFARDERSIRVTRADVPELVAAHRGLDKLRNSGESPDRLLDTRYWDGTRQVKDDLEINKVNGGPARGSKTGVGRLATDCCMSGCRGVAHSYRLDQALLVRSVIECEH